MAIAVLQGHVQRAIDFYNKQGKYFVIGGTIPWADEGSPDAPSATDYKLMDIVAYKRVDNVHLVIPDENGSIQYRTQNWRTVLPPYTKYLTADLPVGTTVLTLNSVEGVTVGSKLRVGDIYEGIVQSFDGTRVTLATPAPESILSGAKVEGGALVEGAKYVYIDCYLNYDQFPLVTYRQIGVCSEVTPSDVNVLRAAAYNPTNGVDEFTSKGVLEIIDNRVPSTRDIDQRELISLVIEF